MTPWVMLPTVSSGDVDDCDTYIQKFCFPAWRNFTAFAGIRQEKPRFFPEQSIASRKRPACKPGNERDRQLLYRLAPVYAEKRPLRKNGWPCRIHWLDFRYWWNRFTTSNLLYAGSGKTEEEPQSSQTKTLFLRKFLRPRKGNGMKTMR